MADNITLQTALSTELNILVVSPNNELMASLKQNLVQAWKAQQAEHPYDCKIHLTSNLTAITERSTNPIKFFDYYVFIIEPKFINCLREVEEHLKSLGEKWGRQKICLVAIGVNYNAAIKPEDLWKFAQIYQFNLLIGELKTLAKAQHLSNRILKLCEASCGLNNGIPLIGKI